MEVLLAVLVITLVVANLVVFSCAARETFESKTKLTAIVLNYNRPHNIPKLISRLETYDEIDEIIVLDGKPGNITNTDNYRKTRSVRDFDNNDKYGGARRFLYDKYQSDSVIFIDDDIIPPQSMVREMLKHINNGSLLVGPVGRICNKHGYGDQNTAIPRARPDTVLTGACMVPMKVLVGYRREFWRTYEPFLRTTHGNGEDLSMNHYIRTKLGKLPTVIKNDIENTDTSNGYSSNPDHYKVRDRICRELFYS